MEILLQPPKSVLFIILGILAVIIASMALKRGNPRDKLLSLIISIVVVCVILVMVYRKGAIVIDRDGLKTRTFGRIEILWDEVQSAEYIEDFESAGYGPKSRVSGIGMPGFNTGLFLLANGQKARIVVQDSKDALLFRTPDGLFLLAPQDFAPLKAEVEKYIELETRGK